MLEQSDRSLTNNDVEAATTFCDAYTRATLSNFPTLIVLHTYDKNQLFKLQSYKSEGSNQCHPVVSSPLIYIFV